MMTIHPLGGLGARAKVLPMDTTLVLSNLLFLRQNLVTVFFCLYVFGFFKR